MYEPITNTERLEMTASCSSLLLLACARKFRVIREITLFTGNGRDSIHSKAPWIYGVIPANEFGRRQELSLLFLFFRVNFAAYIF